MKRIIWLIIAVGAVVYFSNSYIEKRAQEKATFVENERLEHATKSAVSQMASRTNSITDWETILNKGKDFGYGSIMTVELERLWMQKRPILFIGSIKDITTHDQSQYAVLVERSVHSTLGTELQLSLLSNKDRLDSFLKEHPELFEGVQFDNDVAVVAKIDSIRTVYFSEEGGWRKEVKIGEGELIDVLYTGDVRF